MAEKADAVSAGLARAMEMPDAPTKKNAYLEPKLGWSSIDGPWARAEFGYKPFPNVSIYSYGSWTPREKDVGVGLRYEFDLFR